MNKILILIFCFYISISFSFADSLNPLSGNLEAINSGKKLYNIKCSKCHGPKAKGINNGHTKTPDLSKYRRGYIAFIDVLVNGYSRMPAWGGMGKLDSNQIDQLASYIESLNSNNLKWNE